MLLRVAVVVVTPHAIEQRLRQWGCQGQGSSSVALHFAFCGTLNLEFMW